MAKKNTDTCVICGESVTSRDGVTLTPDCVMHFTCYEQERYSTVVRANSPGGERRSLESSGPEA